MKIVSQIAPQFGFGQAQDCYLMVARQTCSTSWLLAIFCFVLQFAPCLADRFLAGHKMSQNILFYVGVKKVGGSGLHGVSPKKFI